MRRSLIVISWISEKILFQLEFLYSPSQIHQVTPVFRISLAFWQYSRTGLFPPIFTNLAWPNFTRSAYFICLEKRYSWVKWTMGYIFLLCLLGFVILPSSDDDYLCFFLLFIFLAVDFEGFLSVSSVFSLRGPLFLENASASASVISTISAELSSRSSTNFDIPLHNPSTSFNRCLLIS